MSSDGHMQGMRRDADRGRRVVRTTSQLRSSALILSLLYPWLPCCAAGGRGYPQHRHSVAPRLTPYPSLQPPHTSILTPCTPHYSHHLPLAPRLTTCLPTYPLHTATQHSPSLPPSPSPYAPFCHFSPTRTKFSPKRNQII